MKKLFLVLTFIVFLAFPAMCEEQCTTTRTDGAIRVGISSNDFSSLQYKGIGLFSAGKLTVYDKFDNTKIVEAAPNEVINISLENSFFRVNSNSSITGPVSIESSSPISISGLKRRGRQAAYRGKLELIRVPRKQDRFLLVNVLPLEDYLKGVVPNEIPTYFGMEALKAQTVAARNYAIRPRVKISPYYDVDDSVKSQVYFGANTEESLSNQAIEATKGLVALYNGDVILALYSSTAGGYTESYENAFSEPGAETFPAKPIPYLKGKPDIEGTPVLNTDDAAKAFYTSSPATFDVGSGLYRWKREWTPEDLRATLNASFNEYTWCNLVSPKPTKGMDIGRIKRVDVVTRGVSGKAMAISVKTDKGEWLIQKELFIRRIFKNKGKALPSANIVFNNVCDAEGNLTKLEGFGGGFGHGVGMSQYGASYMAKNCYTFDQILKRYYDGISLGTWPVYITAEYIKEPIKQVFVAPGNKADLMIDNADGVEKFTFKINSKKFTLGKEYFRPGGVRIPLDKYLQELNEIVYFPITGEDDGASLKVWIEENPNHSMNIQSP